MCPDGWTTGQAAAIGTISAVYYSFCGLLLPGICQWRPVNEVVVHPCYKFITRGNCYAGLFWSPADHSAIANQLLFMAKEEQMLQWDVKSSPKFCICTESSTFKGCGINFVLLWATPLLPFASLKAFPVPHGAPRSFISGRAGSLCHALYHAWKRCPNTHMVYMARSILRCAGYTVRCHSHWHFLMSRDFQVLWCLSATHPSNHK